MKAFETISSLSELNSEDILDTRDLQKLIERLEGERDAASDDPDENEFDEDAAELLKALTDLRSEFSSEWPYGEALIRESYFTDYAREFADDVGYLSKDARNGNPLLDYVDWDAWATAVQQDYTEYEIGGVTYYARS